MDLLQDLQAEWDRPDVPDWKKRRYWTREIEEPGPRFIYKFRSLPPVSEAAKWSVLSELLVEHEIWIAAPVTFRDPMDSHVHFEFASNHAGARRQQLENFLRRAGNLTSAQYRKWVVINKVDITGMVADPAKVAAFFQHAAARNKEVVGVCSFCETIRQSSVWDRYADGHRGIALQFEPMRDPVAFLGYPIRYTDELPIVTDWMAKERDTVRLLDTLLRKATGYRDEKEYRVIDPERTNYGRKYRPEALRAVIFGMKCEEDTRNQVIALLDEREKRTGLRPLLYQARMDSRSGRLRLARHIR